MGDWLTEDVANLSVSQYILESLNFCVVTKLILTNQYIAKRHNNIFSCCKGKSI